MPVKLSFDIDPTSTSTMNCTDFLSSCSIDDDEDTMRPFINHPITEPVLSDDIWKKFELEFPEFSGFDDIFDTLTTSLRNNNSTSSNNNDVVLEPLDLVAEICEIRNHDCMWAGHCGSKEHDDPRHQAAAGCFVSPLPPNTHGATGLKRPPTSSVPPLMTSIKKEFPQQSQPLVAKQQSLLKPNVRAAVVAPLVHVPQTPPMSDDEEVKATSGKPTQVLQILNEAIRECDLDEDSDLCEYFEEDEEEEEEEEEEDEEVDVSVVDESITDAHCSNNNSQQQQQRDAKTNLTYKYAAENDHSYHKGKMENLGIDTPSDSEEEIDVVSVVDKLSYNKVFSLPNKPSTRDRQQIQRRVATAIGSNRVPNNNNNNNNGVATGAAAGIKTILPVRKGTASSTPSTQMHDTTPTSTPVKRKNNVDNNNRNNVGSGGGVKRSRQYRTGINNSPYKKRMYGNSSDSEPEPSEKRSLHNNMERQRRIDLRNAFEDLRILVPEVSKKEKAPKVVILREAAQYCDHMKKVSYNYTKHMEDLKRHQDYLRRRVSFLRKSLAAKR